MLVDIDGRFEADCRCDYGSVIYIRAILLFDQMTQNKIYRIISKIDEYKRSYCTKCNKRIYIKLNIGGWTILKMSTRLGLISYDIDQNKIIDNQDIIDNFDGDIRELFENIDPGSDDDTD